MYVVTGENTMSSLDRIVVYRSWNPWSCWKFIDKLSARGTGRMLVLHRVWPTVSWRGCTGSFIVRAMEGE